MNITIKIDIAKGKYGHDLARTELEIDSDFLDVETVANLSEKLGRSAMIRAHAKLSKDADKPAPDTAIQDEAL